MVRRDDDVSDYEDGHFSSSGHYAKRVPRSKLAHGVPTKLSDWKPIYGTLRTIESAEDLRTAFDELSFELMGALTTDRRTHRDLQRRLLTSADGTLRALQHWLTRGDGLQEEYGVLYLSNSTSFRSLRLWHDVERLSRELGYATPALLEVSEGSVLARFRVWLKRQIDDDDHRRIAAEIASEGRQYLENLTLGKTQAEIDLSNSQAVESLLSHVTEEDEVAIHVGSILIVKYRAAGKSVLNIETLTPRQQAVLSSHPELTLRPASLKQDLADIISLEKGQEPRALSDGN